MYLDKMGFPQIRVNLAIYSLESVLIVFLLVTYQSNLNKCCENNFRVLGFT